MMIGGVCLSSFGFLLLAIAPGVGSLAYPVLVSAIFGLGIGFVQPTSLVAAQSQRPVQLQTMRRDMGGGKFVMMKTAGAPVRVRGRHWGAVSIAYILP